jgi:hypothetical protein
MEKKQRNETENLLCIQLQNKKMRKDYILKNTIILNQKKQKIN